MRPTVSALPALLVILTLAACGSDSTAPEEELEPVTLVAADRDGNIYTINQTTGAETLILNTTTQSSTGSMVDVGVVSSMLWVESTGKWWLGTGGNAECGGCIQTLDLATGVATMLSQPGPNGISGLAIHPTTGEIYTWESDSTNELYELDPVTGALTPVFGGLSLDSGGTGTTFSLDGTLYVAAYRVLATINLTTGATNETSMSYTGFPTFVNSSQTIGSMATRPSDGTVFGLLKDGGRSGTLQPTYLVTINLTTGEVTNLGQQGELMDGLAFVPTDELP
jgi:hypothetical protein